MGMLAFTDTIPAQGTRESDRQPGCYEHNNLSENLKSIHTHDIDNENTDSLLMRQRMRKDSLLKVIDKTTP